MLTGRVVFWQNMLSIHQAPLVRAMEAFTGADVVVISQEVGLGERGKEGWSRPDFGNASVVEGIRPNEAIDLAQSIGVGAVNIISGVGSYSGLDSVSQFLLSSGSLVIFQSENWDPRGIAGIIRHFRYWRRRNYVTNGKSALLAMGNLGVSAFSSAGFDTGQIFQFGYFTSLSNVAVNSQDRDGLIYVGSLSKLKDVSLLIRAVKQTDSFSRLTIVGDGPQREHLESLAESDSRVHFLGPRDNRDAVSLMASHEVAVLPSRYDGWGAVINEALSVGTPVVCSSAVGAATLLEGPGPSRGQVFVSRDATDLRLSLEYVLDSVRSEPNLHSEIRDWALSRISPESGSRYLAQIIEYLQARSQYVRAGSEPRLDVPIPPWLV